MDLAVPPQPNQGVFEAKESFELIWTDLIDCECMWKEGRLVVVFNKAARFAMVGGSVKVFQ